MSAWVPKFHLLHRASQKADLLFSEKQPTVTARQYVVMVALQGSPGMSQTKLTRITGVDRSTLSKLIGKLQQQGYFHDGDRQRMRAYRIRLTLAGTAAVVANRAAAQQADFLLFSALPGSELTNFLKQLERILAG